MLTLSLFPSPLRSLPGLLFALVLSLGFNPPSAVAQTTGPLSGVTAVVAGASHSCALMSGGAVKCWGSNGSGQLGDGTAIDRPTPVTVSGLTSGVTAIAAGGYHTCALTNGGAVKCWGYNYFGQIGDNSTTNRTAPVAVSGLGSGAVAISAGGNHTCAITAAGAVQCWGYNGAGQIGDNSTFDRWTPATVSGISSATSIAAGAFHTCAVTTGGAAKCWGWNYSGQLGDNSTNTRLAPVSVSGLSSGVAAVATGGSHSCARLADGSAQCWGSNANGQLGDGTVIDRLTPVGVSSVGTTVAQLSTGSNHTCMRSAASGAKCWGSNGNGQVGDNTYIDRSVAVDVLGLTSGVASVGTGYNHSCAVKTDSTLTCWGYNIAGQLGDNSTTTRPAPVAVVVPLSVPDAPSIGVATPGVNTATVTFTANGNGGAAIDRFKVTCNPGTASATGPSSPIIVSGLTNGTAYTCTVTAHNSVGWSAPSAASNSVTPNTATEPVPPTGVNGTPGDSKITVSFTASASPGTLPGGALATLTGYTAQCGSQTNTGAGSPIVVSGLTNGTAYTCTVKATNNVPLDSVWSAPSAPVTPFSAPACALDIDGDGHITADRDGVLLMRYLFGFRDTALIANIAQTGATRTLPGDIQNYINANLASYDVFGRNPAPVPPAPRVTATQDAFVFLRVLMGFPDSALLSGIALPDNATNTTAAAVRGQLVSQCGALPN